MLRLATFLYFWTGYILHLWPHDQEKLHGSHNAFHHKFGGDGQLSREF